MVQFDLRIFFQIGLEKNHHQTFQGKFFTLRHMLRTPPRLELPQPKFEAKDRPRWRAFFWKVFGQTLTHESSKRVHCAGKSVFLYKGFEHVYSVDGKNPANQLIYSLSMCIPVCFSGFLYVVVQDFFHQQYVTLYMCLYVYCILVFFVNNKDNGWSTNTPLTYHPQK